MPSRNLTTHPNRKAAQAAGRMFYQVPDPCRHGHTAPRYARTGACLACSRQRYHGKVEETRIHPEKSVAGTARVYVFATAGYAKVGMSARVEPRLAAVRSSCPTPVDMVYCSDPIPRALAQQIEGACHAALAEHRVNGEWFKAPLDEVLAVVQKEAVFA